MENIDSRLLRNQDEEQDAARKLKEEKRGQTGEEGGEAEAGEGRSFMQTLRQARQLRNLKETAKEKLKEKALAPAKQGTNNLLRWAWGITFSVIGFLPGLLYINAHVFLKSVLGENLFCKLGEEWLPKQVTALGGEAGKSLGKSVGIIEVMGLLFLDLMALIIVLGALGVFILICNIIQNPLSYIGEALGMAWNAVTGVSK